MKLCVALAMALVGSACFAEEASLTFQRSGQTIPLAPKDAQRIIQKIEILVRSANFNSLYHPGGFNGLIGRPLEEVRKDSFLHVHYSAPITFFTIGGALIADDIWIDIRPQNPGAGLYPGPTRLVNAAGGIWLGKESGMLMIDLGLDPAIYPHLPRQMQKDLESGAPKSDDDLLAEARGVITEKKLEVPDPTNAVVLKQYDYRFVEFYEPNSSKILVRLYFDRFGRRYPLVDQSGRIPPIVQSMDVSQYRSADSLWDQIQKLAYDDPKSEKWPQLFHATSEFLMRYPHDPRRWEATDLWLCNGPFMDGKLVEKFFADVRIASDASPAIKERARQWEEHRREHERNLQR